MNYTSFSPLHISGLSISNLYGLNKSMIELVQPLTSHLNGVLNAVFNELVQANQTLGNNMNQNQRSLHTGSVKTMDKERDQFAKEIFRVPASLLKSSNDAKRAAATSLQLFLSPYKGIENQPINTESSSIDSMVSKFRANSTLVEAAKVLDIEEVFVKLEAKNAELKAHYTDRTDEYATKADSASEAKPAAVAANIQFSTALEQAYNYTPSDEVTALFNRIDEIRKTYHRLDKNKKDSSESTEPEK